MRGFWKTARPSLASAVGMLLITSVANAASTSVAFGPDISAGSNFPAVTGSSYQVTMTYEDTTGLLTVDVWNNSPASVSGFMTAFVFDTPGNLALTTFTPPADGDPWTATLAQSAAPYGNYDLLTSATNSDWEGGGMPKGLAPGEQQTFSYQFNGLLSVNIDDFVADTTSSPKGDFFFAGRFRGITEIEGVDSDKLPNAVVPIPGAVWLMGTSLIALAGLARRKRSASGV